MYCKNCGEPMNDNQAVCLKCGVASGNGKSFCPNCGTPTKEEASFCVNCGVALNNGAKSNFTPSLHGLEVRSIVTAIILSVITCGIYGIYWFVRLTDEFNQASGNNDVSGGVAFLLSLVTCGLYSWYWAYKLGEKRDTVANENASTNIIYLLLSVFGLGIVVYILAQDSLNKAIEKDRY